MVDTETASGPGEHGTLRERAVDNIRILRDLCDGMEYQLQFNHHHYFRRWNGKGQYSWALSAIV